MILRRGTAAVPAPWRDARVVTATVAGALLLVGWLAGLGRRGSLAPIHLALYLAAIAIGGYHVGRAGLVALVGGRGLTIMVVMLLAAVAAAALGQVAAGALLIVLYAAADATAAYAGKAQRLDTMPVMGAGANTSRAAAGIERLGARVGLAVLLIGLVVAVALPLIGLLQDQSAPGAPGLEDASWGAWAVRATMVVVAATPCAPILAIPLALAVTLRRGAERGVRIADARSVGALARIRVVALDQASAVTRGAAEVAGVLPWRDAPSRPLLSPQEIIALAAGVVRQRDHPLARAIVAHAAAQAIEPVAAGKAQALADVGTVAHVDGATVFVGRPALFMGPLHISLDTVRDPIARWQDEGKTVVVVGDRTGVRGLIALRVPVDPAVRGRIAALRAGGVRRVALLTDGDARPARALARELGLDTVIADLTPETTVAAVRDLARQSGGVALVGNGVGDAAALAAATVGVALRAEAGRGDDAPGDAPGHADAAVVADDLDGVIYALTLARRNRRVIRQTVALWASVTAALIGGIVAGVLSLPHVVLGHELGEFVAIGGALCLLRRDVGGSRPPSALASTRPEGDGAPTARATVVGVFTDRAQAARAVAGLRQMGFRDIRVARHGLVREMVRGALVGAGAGGLVGGVLGTAATGHIPGSHPAIAGPPTVAALVGAALVAAVGGIVGASYYVQVPDSHPRSADAAFGVGRIVVVAADGRADEAAAILGPTARTT